jgi:hypothetical protein
MDQLSQGLWITFQQAFGMGVLQNLLPSREIAFALRQQAALARWRQRVPFIHKHGRRIALGAVNEPKLSSDQRPDRPCGIGGRGKSCLKHSVHIGDNLLHHRKQDFVFAFDVVKQATGQDANLVRQFPNGAPRKATGAKQFGRSGQDAAFGFAGLW